MSDFAERLRSARGLRSMTQADLARHAGSSRSMVAAYELGYREPKYTTTLRLSRALGVSLEWLRSGSGDMEVIEEPVAIGDSAAALSWGADERGNLIRLFRGIPLLHSHDRIPTADEWEILAYAGDRCLPIDDLLARHLGPMAFAVYVPDEAMQPLARGGDIAIVDPDHKPAPGALVVAKTADDAPTLILRRYKQRRVIARLVEELVANSDYWPLITVEGDTKIIGTVRALLLFTYDYRVD